ncbi:DUF268 domain-containing protein [Agrobacterium rosae]|uniref:DUF268 domain-containing protein n=1 Tax=Agrobacterium rosae TaxID=1972867 RepID=A0ABU4VQW3_9HYPH|nr:DUF268 domain-containing protein [Agrobacterium rosae]MDX8327893.1 DUF268 domain-containing protein [Agrobacterium rosae]
MSLLRELRKMARVCGIDTNKLYNYRFMRRYLADKKEWLEKGGKIDKLRMVLEDFSDSAGIVKGHYFHQDLLVAGYIHAANPVRHIDVGSRIDGFVAHVASFREIEVLDVRPLQPTSHKNIVFQQADLMRDAGEEITDSLSCLHAIEHFGLGRYGDPIDVAGHERGISNLVRMLKNNGILYISFPIGRTDQVHFNAHRVFHATSLLNYDSIKLNMTLERFDYVDDLGDLKLGETVDGDAAKVRYGCGIYTLRKTNSQAGG